MLPALGQASASPTDTACHDLPPGSPAVLALVLWNAHISLLMTLKTPLTGTLFLESPVTSHERSPGAPMGLSRSFPLFRPWECSHCPKTLLSLRPGFHYSGATFSSICGMEISRMVPFFLGILLWERVWGDVLAKESEGPERDHQAWPGESIGLTILHFTLIPLFPLFYLFFNCFPSQSVIQQGQHPLRGC